MAKLGDYIREECNPLGSTGAQELRLIGVSNEHGLHLSSRETSADLARYQRIERNWFAYNPMRVNVGSIGLADDECKIGYTSPDYTVFSCREGLNPHYLLYFLKSDYGLEAIARNCSGAVRKRLYFSGLADIELPVPSIEEQCAIVTRINGIREIIRFIREENSDRHELPQLKQAILQEAIEGKLTEDWRAANPDVEPASELLKRIQAEKARLVAAKKLRPENPLPKITPGEIPFEIPKGWVWCRLGEVISFTSGDGLTAAQMAGGDIPVFGGNGINGYHNEANIESETIVVGRVGANCGAVHKTPARAWVTDNAFSTTFSSSCVNMDFLVWLLRFLNLNHLSFAGSQPVISGKRVYPLPTPLPPLAEQAAIVERVESLMATCRELEAEIEKSRTYAEHLLQAVLKEAFAPSE
ncbi:MAG: restriction endonuclease subunit S [Opitutales bacterium]|nr:restriction endonuclease subunit S [Opitutales bacterium]